MPDVRPPFHPRRGLRQKILSGALAFGSTCTSGSPQLIEIMGFSGLDFVMIDNEHSDGALIAETAALIRAADSAGIPALVRLDALRPESILHVLDYGAIGVVAPHIKTPADARALVRAVKYHPEGDRGTCPQIRAMRYGGYEDWNDYWPVANAETIAIALIEDPEGIENIEDIVSTPGIDAIWIGLADLAQSRGLSNDRGHPYLREAQKRGQSAARAAGKRCIANLAVNAVAEQLPGAIADGYSVFMISCDTSIFRDGLRRIVDATRSSVGAGT